jgi:hypothetical protein
LLGTKAMLLLLLLLLLLMMLLNVMMVVYELQRSLKCFTVTYTYLVFINTRGHYKSI